MKAAINNLSKQNPLLLAAGAALLLYAVYLIARKALGDTAAAAGGILSGNNALTDGTVYAGDGIAGTLGAGVNSVLGGVPQALGDWVASVFSTDSGSEDLYYNVMFPDGASHAIASGDVASDGSFTYNGTAYVLGMQGTQRVAKVAQ